MCPSRAGSMECWTLRLQDISPTGHITYSVDSSPTLCEHKRMKLCDIHCVPKNKSSTVAEMGDRGHNRHGPKRGRVLCPFRGALGTRLIQYGLCGGLLPYQVASSSIQPFGHNSVGCHSPRRNISTNY